MVMRRAGPARRDSANHVRRANRAALNGRFRAPQSARSPYDQGKAPYFLAGRDKMYRALYRKWRPAVFDDVCGQPFVVRVLKNQVESGRISHAYLFSGSRGTGKTTCAKILAKAANCPNSVGGEPCNKCDVCRGIDSGSVTDVVEIDAASNNGVDNVRALREETNFTPAYAKYRVYIVDEVHMLSPGAFNALLKTLEEPPSYVIFILATTEIHKLPATVVSRCQRFDFKRLSSEDIKKRLLFVAEKENVGLTDAAASLIARLADGGMRDALSLLDRCLTSGDLVDEAAVSDAAGIAGTDRLFAVSEYVLKGDCSGVLKLISRLYAESCDADSLCSELLRHFRNLTVAKTVEDCGELASVADEELSALKERAREFSLPRLLFCLELLEKASVDLKFSLNKKIVLETAVIKACSPFPESFSGPGGGLEERVSALEEKLDALSLGARPSAAEPENKAETVSAVGSPPVPEPEKEKPLEPPGAPAAGWPEILEKLKLYDAPLFGLLANSEAKIKDGRILIGSGNSALGDFLRRESHLKELLRAAFEVSGKRFKIEIEAPVKISSAEAGLEKLKNKIDAFNGKINKSTEETI